MVTYSSKNPYGSGKLDPLLNLDPADFNELVGQHGIRIQVEKTTVCPNYASMSNVKENRHNPDCTICENNFISYDTFTCWGLFQQNMFMKAFLERGEFPMPGQALITIPSEKEPAVVDVSAYTVAKSATIVSPAIPFLSNGTVSGTFTVGSITNLSVGKTISVDDSDSSPTTCKIKTISGSASPYTITVEELHGDDIIIGLYDKITLLDQTERFYELFNKSGAIVADLSAYTTAQSAHIVSPNIAFASDGTAGGTFTVASLGTLAVGQTIGVIDNNTAVMPCYIVGITGTAAPYTITVKTYNPVDILRYQAVDIEYITTATRGTTTPFVKGTDYELDANKNIHWLSGGSHPSWDVTTGLGEIITVSYVFKPVYRVMQLMHEGRYSQKYTSTGRETTRFPQMALLRKDYYVFKRDGSGVIMSQTPADQTDVDDPSEPSSGGW